jgi:hypothetical protein
MLAFAHRRGSEPRPVSNVGNDTLGLSNAKDVPIFKNIYNLLKINSYD